MGICYRERSRPCLLRKESAMSGSLSNEQVDLLLFRRNRDQFPDEQLEPYRGKQVAWNADGTRIVASGDDHEQLYERLAALGIHPAVVVDEFIPDPNASFFGCYRVHFDREVDRTPLPANQIAIAG